MAKKLLSEILAKTKSDNKTPDKQGKDDKKAAKKETAKPFWSKKKD